MVCKPTPVSTLYRTSTTLIPTTITTSTPIVVTPKLSTSTWLITSCTTSTNGLAGLGAVMLENQGTVTHTAGEQTAEATATAAPGEVTGQASGAKNVYSGTSTSTKPTVLAVKTSCEGGDVASITQVDSGGGLGANIAHLAVSDEKTPLAVTAAPASVASTGHTAQGWLRGEGAAETAIDSNRFRHRYAVHAAPENQLRPRAFGWGDAWGSVSEDSQVSCLTITSTTTIYGTPTTSWEKRYVTSRRTSTARFPTQTVYGVCESDSTSDVESTGSGGSAMETAARSTQEGGKDSGTSTTSSSDDLWNMVATDSKTYSSTSSMSAGFTTPSTLTSVHSSSVLLSSTALPSTTAAPTSSDYQAGAASSSTTSSTVTSASDSDGHVKKVIATGPAVGGVFGFFALLALILFGIRWWKIRQRDVRTQRLRSTWFDDGDAGDIEDAISKTSVQPPQNLQSRFSVPSVLSRHSLTIPPFLSHPISHMRQSTFGSTLPPILLLKHLRNSVLPSKAQGDTSAMHEKTDTNLALADTYTEVPAPVAVTDARMRRASPPRAFMMSPPLDSQTGSSFQMGAGHAGPTDTGPYPSVSPGVPSLPDLILNGSPPITWGSSYAERQVKGYPFARSTDDPAGLAPDVRMVAPTPSNASHSMYSRASTGPALSRGGTMKSNHSDGESVGDVSGVGARLGRFEAESFPLPPLSNPPSHPDIPARPVTRPLQVSTPPPPVPRGPPELPFPNFSHPNPGVGRSDAHTMARSTAYSSGVWEYDTYADSGVGAGPDTARDSQQNKAQAGGSSGHSGESGK